MRKRLTKLLILMFTFSLLSGCSDNANGGAKENNEDTKKSEENLPEEEEKQEGEEQEENVSNERIEVVLASGGRTLDPAAATDRISAIFVNAAYDQLVSFGTTEHEGMEVADPDNVQPSLAKSWDVSADGLEYIFYLDENAKFANGDNVNAKAVIYSLNRVKNSDTASFLFALTNIEQMEEIDEYTVKCKLSQPCTILLKLLQMHILSIINPKELEGLEDVDDYLANNIAGSGAYGVEQWESAGEAVLTAREDYWKGKAKNKGVNIRVVEEPSKRLALAENGDVDIVMSIPAKDKSLLTANKNGKVNANIYESNAVTFLAMNTKVEPFDNELVRQAINYAIPKDIIVDSVLYGLAAPLDYAVPSAMPGFIANPSKSYELDLEKAKELLKEAGYEDGFEFTLSVNSSEPEALEASVLIQAGLSKLNIKANIDKEEATYYSEMIRSDKMEMAVCTYTAFVNDPGYFFGNTLHSKGEYNYAKYSNKKVDSYWEEAEKTNDSQLRLDNYKKAQEIVFKEAPWVVLYEGRTMVVLHKSVKDYIHYPDGALRFRTISK